MSQINTYPRIEKIGAIAGIISIIFYISAVAIPLPSPIPRLLAFTFPLLWIISYMAFYHFLKKERHTPTLEIAYIFGIIGATLACSLLVVQQANIIWHNEAMEAAQDLELPLRYAEPKPMYEFLTKTVNGIGGTGLELVKPGEDVVPPRDDPKI